MGSRMQQSSGKNKMMYQNQQIGEEEDEGEEDADNQHIDAEPSEQQEQAEDVIELSEEQLVELLQNADKLTPEQQEQLQLILKDRWKQEIKNQKQLQYDNIYNILTENVAKAKVRLANLADSPNKKKTLNRAEEDAETMERIIRQKREYETLLKAYNME